MIRKTPAILNITSNALAVKTTLMRPEGTHFFWLTNLKTLVICAQLFDVLTSQVKLQSWRQISSLDMLN